MRTERVKIIPVLESGDIDREAKWYKEKTGFELSFSQIPDDNAIEILY